MVLPNEKEDYFENVKKYLTLVGDKNLGID